MVTEDMPDNLSVKNGDVNVHFNQNCLGDIQNNEDKTCTITNTNTLTIYLLYFQVLLSFLTITCNNNQL